MVEISDNQYQVKSINKQQQISVETMLISVFLLWQVLCRDCAKDINNEVLMDAFSIIVDIPRTHVCRCSITGPIGLVSSRRHGRSICAQCSSTQTTA